MRCHNSSLSFALLITVIQSMDSGDAFLYGIVVLIVFVLFSWFALGCAAFIERSVDNIV